MRDFKRGLSTIVSTLIIILLVFVAIGIVWVVVRNLVSGGSSQVDLASKCLEVVVTPTKVVSLGNVYNVTVLRTGSGSEMEISGIKLIFTSNSSDSNFIHNVPGNIAPLSVKTISVEIQDISNPDKVDAVVYFKDNSGNDQLCTDKGTYNF